MAYLPASASAALKNAIKASSAFSWTGALESATVFLKSGPKTKEKIKSKHLHTPNSIQTSFKYIILLHFLLLSSWSLFSHLCTWQLFVMPYKDTTRSIHAK